MLFCLNFVFLIIFVIPTYCRFPNTVQFDGIYPPVFTPFDKSGELNISVIPQYARFLKNSGVDGVVVADIIGEGFCLSIPEKKRLVDAWATACKPLGLKVIVHIGTTALVEKIELAKYYELLGIDAILLLIKPYNILDTTDNTEKFLIIAEEISRAVSLPFFYHNYPQVSKIWVDVPTLFKKASKKFPQFIGIMADLCVAVNVTAQVDIRRDQYIGITNDLSIASGALNGFNTFSVTSANFLPLLVKDIINFTKAGEITNARRAQERLNKILVAISSLGNEISALKATMEIITGIKVGWARKPSQPIPQRTVKYITRILEEYNIEIVGAF